MSAQPAIFSKIKKIVAATEPTAEVIVFGSYARGEQRSDSDIDVLILVDKSELTLEEEKCIKYPLYDLEFETGQIISPLVLTKEDWEKRHAVTPLYENIQQEGIAL
ncbi:MAG: nucleotidyltransferase domain-containing protein [Saprospiraceae bacterium]|nr:nucleotidyltransferase domain-containing protein [Saprospiraceae bacterium]